MTAVADIVYIIGSIWSGYLYTIDVSGIYRLGKGYLYTLICPFLILGLCTYVNMRRKISPQKRIPMLAFCITPVATGIITIFIKEYTYTYVIVSYILLLLYGTIQRERNLELSEKKKELAEKQVQLMVSQINPHFMYNTLATIRSLCHTDPALAAYTVNQFALYLRGNMDMMMQLDPIMIELEMRHVRYFTQIERTRLAQMIDGKMEIRSVIGEGTTVTITIPIPDYDE